jgi:hypothetical protein
MLHCFEIRLDVVNLCDGHTLEQHFLCLHSFSSIF